MRVVFLWQYYKEYLAYFLARHPEVASLPFEAHRERLLDDRFIWPSELSGFMCAQGIASDFIVSNDEGLQRKWADENGVDLTAAAAGWEQAVALEQVRRARPDVLWVSQAWAHSGPFLREARRLAGKIIAWVGEPWPTPPDLEGVSVLITENPDTYRELHARFERTIVTTPGFNPGTLGVVGEVDKRIPLLFIGRLLPVHARRAALLAFLLRNGIPIRIHGIVDGEPRPSLASGVRLAAWYAAKRRDPPRARATLRRTLRPTAFEDDMDTIRKACLPPVFGVDACRVLAASHAVVNVHADIAGRHAGNSRMFETTGMGACLITEESANIRTLFEPGREVLTYRNREELLEICRRCLADPAMAGRVAAAGQARTLAQHTLARMFADIRPALEPRG